MGTRRMKQSCHVKFPCLILWLKLSAGLEKAILGYGWRAAPPCVLNVLPRSRTEPPLFALPNQESRISAGFCLLESRFLTYLEQAIAPSSLFIRSTQEGGFGARVTLLLPDSEADVRLSVASPAPLDAAGTHEQ